MALKIISLFIFVLIGCATCSIQSDAKDLSLKQNESIETSHRKCTEDNDCAIVMLKCSCDCGTAVAKKYADLYRDATKDQCKDYVGPVCKMACRGTAQCISNLCSIKE